MFPERRWVLTLIQMGGGGCYGCLVEIGDGDGC